MCDNWNKLKCVDFLTWKPKTQNGSAKNLPLITTRPTDMKLSEFKSWWNAAR
jgi:hypothetical protein